MILADSLWRWNRLAALASLLIAFAIGCDTTSKSDSPFGEAGPDGAYTCAHANSCKCPQGECTCPNCPLAELPPPSPLADYAASLPEHVVLPSRFYPLKGQYDPGNPDDHYNGWPRYIVCEADEMILAYVPSQVLMMGGGLDIDEVPARQIVVNHFYMDLHEVSNAQFSRFCTALSDEKSKPEEMFPGYRKYWVPGHNDHFPVRYVSWFEAAEYAAWAGRQLPTEAQWETAARGGDRRIYPWGNDRQSEVTRFLCNARTDRRSYDGYDFTAPVMNYSAGISPFGIYNLAGNVWEWCGDWYDPGRYAYPSSEDPPTGLERGVKPFGDVNYPNPLAKVIRPERVGPIVGGQRVIRGGSFTDPIDKCRVDARAPAAPDVRQHNVGFRCILALPPQM